MASRLDKSEWMVVVILRMIGIGGLLAIPAVFFPYSWMNACHEFLGMGTMPDEPIVGYLARSLSAFYAFVGALILFISFDVPRYQALIKLFAIIAMILGVTLFVIDLSSGMPTRWTLIEGPLTLIFGAILFRLQNRNDKLGGESAESP